MNGRLAVISNMAHYTRDGETVGWGPAVQELDQVADLFDEVVHVCCLNAGAAPNSALPYRNSKIRTVFLPPAGGETLAAKLAVLMLLPRYVRVVWREIHCADAVHVRAPANISLVAMLLLAISRKPRARWIKYAGNWSPEKPDGWSYGFQRWWLRRKWHRSLVTVNGAWPGQPDHVRTFINPCLTDAEIQSAGEHVSEKVLDRAPRLLFAGSIISAKGLDVAIEAVSTLQKKGVAATLDVIGDGPGREDMEKLAKSFGAGNVVTFHGWIPRPELARYYERAHFLVLPSKTEGWPKVISEGFAYGVVPVVTSVSSIPQILEAAHSGTAVSERSSAAFAAAIDSYVNDPARWLAESRNGLKAAGRFTYSAHIAQIRKAFHEHFAIDL